MTAVREHRSSTVAQASRFVLVGLGTLLLDFGTYRGLLALGVAVSPAKAAGFLLGTTAAYLLNRAWTFRAPGGAAAVRSFVLLYAATLVLNVLVNAVVLQALGERDHAIEVAFLVAQALTTLANFVGLRLLVFPASAAGAPLTSTSRARGRG